MARAITSDNITSVLENDIVLMDFWAEWCSPCRVLSPIIDEISEDNSDVVVGKIDVDKDGALAQEYNIRSIPTLIFLKNGEVTTTMSGIKSNAEIQDILNSMKK